MMKEKPKEDESVPEFAEVVSMQGLKPILDPKSGYFRKFVWLMVVLFALAFTAYNITKQVLIFLGNPISVNMDIRRATELPFPAVTICSFNFLRKSATNHESRDVLPMVDIMKPLQFIRSNDTPVYDGVDFSHFHSPGAWERMYVHLGHNAYTSLLRCQWELQYCTAENFTHIFTDFGMCFEFNADGHLKARNSGRDYGVKFSLSTDQENYFRSFAGHYGAGFKIAVHPHSVLPSLGERGISVSPGFHTSLAVSVKKMKNAPVSVSSCGSKPLKYYVDKPYSMEACRVECMTEFVVKHCGCREIYMPGNEILTCDPPVLYSCVYPKIDEYLTSSDKSCETSCPEPCSSYIYDTIPSAATFSDVFVEKYSNHTGQAEENVRRNLVELEIYLTSMYYEYVEKRLAYSLLDLLCDIGGAFGLLLGASFLTLLEIVDFMLLRPKNKAKPKQVQVQPVNVRPRF